MSTKSESNAPDELLGRDEALERLHALVSSSAVSCLYGLGGVGKTRLAQALAAKLGADAVMWVELGSDGDEGALIAALAQALGVSLAQAGQDQASAQAQLKEALTHRALALLIVEAPHDVASSPQRLLDLGVSLLWISRVRPAWAGVDALKLEPLGQLDAQALYLRIAAQRAPGVLFDETLVATLVVRLDRLPLALVLSATRVKLLPPAAQLERLAQRFELLRGVDALPSLEAMVRLSLEALTPEARALLEALSRFDGPVELEVVEAILGEGCGALWARLEALHDAGFVQLLGAEGLGAQAGHARFTLLESVRAYLRLNVQPDPAHERALAQRELAFYLEHGRALAREARQARGPQARQRFIALRPELERLWRAHQPSEAQGVAALLAMLYGELGAPLLLGELGQQLGRAGVAPAAQVLAVSGELALAGGHSERAALTLSAAVEAGAEVYATLLRAEALRVTGQAAAARAALDEVSARCLAGGALLWAEDASIARLYHALSACVFADLGQLELAERALYALSTIAVGTWWRAELLCCHREAYACFYLGEVMRQRAAIHRAVALAEQVAEPGAVARAVQGLAEVDFVAGQWERAAQGFERAVSLLRAQGLSVAAAIALGSQGAALHRMEALEDAQRCYLEALEAHQVNGAWLYVGVVAVALGALYHETQRLALAQRAYEQAQRAFTRIDADEDLGAVALLSAWVAVEQGLEREAMQRLERAVERFEAAATSVGWAQLATLSRAWCGEPAKALPAPAEASSLVRFLTEVLSAGLVEDEARLQALAHREQARGSLYGRLALRLARSPKRARFEPKPSSAWPADAESEPQVELGQERSQPKHTLKITEGVMSFCVDDGEPVNLGRRKALRLVLTALIEALKARPQEGLGVFELFEQGWPGQNVAPEHAAERVYWAVRTLRSLGLDGLLLTLDEGYALDVGLDVCVEPG